MPIVSGALAAAGAGAFVTVFIPDVAGIARLPYAAAVGAEIDITSNTAVNESAGGFSGRLSIRQTPIRQFHLTIGPNEAAEVKAIHYTHRRRWPVAVRDWGDYTYTNEILAPGSGPNEFPLRRKIMPVTGARFLYQRILIPDEAEVPTVVAVNGTPLIRTAWNFVAAGIVYIPGYSSGIVTATGRYLVAACFMQDILTAKVFNTSVINLPDVQLREILEPELLDLLSQADDSV
ncbi:MAG: hypothetical protein JWP25_8957 [Bradyrhizobium sp.]|nr:hypothetical protein [Bradyrhizobium sp.]